MDESSQLQLIIELAIEGLRLRTYPPTTQPSGLQNMSPSERLNAFRQAVRGQRQANANPAYTLDFPGDHYATNSGVMGCTKGPDNRGIVFRSLWQDASKPDTPPWRDFDDLGVSIHKFTFDLVEDLLVLVTPLQMVQVADTPYVRTLIGIMVTDDFQ